jgi:hypothetical protein
MKWFDYLVPSLMHKKWEVSEERFVAFVQISYAIS